MTINRFLVPRPTALQSGNAAAKPTRKDKKMGGLGQLIDTEKQRRIGVDDGIAGDIGGGDVGGQVDPVGLEQTGFVLDHIGDAGQ